MNLDLAINPVIPWPVMAGICVVLLILKRKGWLNFLRQLVIVILLFMINLRIAVPSDSVTVVKRDVDVLFVVDNTISMLAEDYGVRNKRRIDGVKSDIAEIIDSFEGARFALITFTDSANYLVPYTSEFSLVTQAVNELNGQTKSYGSGTSLNVVLKTFEDNLEANAESMEEEDDDRMQLVFFISDGEITDEKDKLESFEDLSEYIDGGAVLGYGSDKGGEMRVKYSATSEEYELLTYYDDHYNLITPKSYIDEKNLNAVADDLGIDYYHMDSDKDTEKMIDEMLSKIENGDFSKSQETGEGYDEIYWIFALALAGFLLIDFIYYRLFFGKER